MRRPLAVLVAIAVAAALATPVQAADCLDYTDFLHHLGLTGAPTFPSDVAVADHLACLTDAGGDLHVFDVADPRAPQLLAVYQANSGLLRVIIRDSLAYVSDNAAQLLVIDLADPTVPRLVTTLTLPDIGRDLHLTADLLLVACGEAGVAILDLTDPANPQTLTTMTTPGAAYGVAAAANLAVIADGDEGLHTVDITDPANPQPIASFRTVAPAYDVALHDQIAHVACDDSGLELVAVIDPASPVSLAQLPLPGLVRRLRVDGATTYAIGADLFTIDTADPFGPVLRGRAAADNPRAVVVVDKLAFLATVNAGLVIFDAANPASPDPISTTQTAELAYGIAIDGSLTYLAAGDLIVYDHSDPENPVEIASAPIPGNASRVVLAAGHAYITSAGLAGLLYVVDIGDPTQPIVVNEIEFPGYPGPIIAHGNALYLGDFFYGGLYILDLADPADPQLLPTVPTGIYAITLAAHDDRLFVATGAFGGATIETHDITDPLAPVLLHTLATDHQSIDGMVAAGNLLYTTPNGDDQTGLTILDYTQPTAPVELAHVPLPGIQRALVLAGETVHVASEQRTLQVIDVINPTAPVRLGELSLPGTTFVIVTVGDRVHAAATYAGLAILPGHCDGSVPVLDPGQDDVAPDPIAPLLTAYPNPFNPQVTLRFTLPEAEPTTLDIFDLAGRRVARLVAGDRPAGEHRVTWRANELPSGTYLARLETPSLVRISKLVLLQ